MRLGSPQQLAKVNVLEVPVASTRINVLETARDLGVVVIIIIIITGRFNVA